MTLEWIGRDVLDDVDDLIISYEVWLEALSRLPAVDAWLYYYVGPLEDDDS